MGLPFISMMKAVKLDRFGRSAWSVVSMIKNVVMHKLVKDHGGCLALVVEAVKQATIQPMMDQSCSFNHAAATMGAPPM